MADIEKPLLLARERQLLLRSRRPVLRRRGRLLRGCGSRKLSIPDNWPVFREAVVRVRRAGAYRERKTVRRAAAPQARWPARAQGRRVAVPHLTASLDDGSPGRQDARRPVALRRGHFGPGRTGAAIQMRYFQLLSDAETARNSETANRCAVRARAG